MALRVKLAPAFCTTVPTQRPQAGWVLQRGTAPSAMACKPRVLGSAALFIIVNTQPKGWWWQERSISVAESRVSPWEMGSVTFCNEGVGWLMERARSPLQQHLMPLIRLQSAALLLRVPVLPHALC